jgi:hypothetical protein
VYFLNHAGLGNLTNAILDAILILLLGLGVRGAAIATVTSEYVKDTYHKMQCTIYPPISSTNQTLCSSLSIFSICS